MRILSISAQKPNSTGSGIYMTELINAFDAAGHQQAVIAGVNNGDTVDFPKGVQFFPVTFKTDDLPFPVCGMSDEMPYESTRYCDMTDVMRQQFQTAFVNAAGRVIEEFSPDLIICHHLYLMTATIRDYFPEEKIVGICHNTDLRQLGKTGLARDYISEKINGLDEILALHQEQKDTICRTFRCPQELVRVIGSGYNSEIFSRGNDACCGGNHAASDDGRIHIAYAGKIAVKKGLLSLIRSSHILAKLLEPDEPEVVFHMAGSAGNQEEYDEITSAAAAAPYEFEFTGPLSQPKLAEVYRRCQLFVLPSFYEGLPLSPVEAMACGCRAVITDVPGVRNWISANAPAARITYVPLPEMQNVDEPVLESLPDFETAFAKAVCGAVKMLPEEKDNKTDLTGITWSGLAHRVLRD